MLGVRTKDEGRRTKDEVRLAADRNPALVLQQGLILGLGATAVSAVRRRRSRRLFCTADTAVAP